MFVKNDFVIGFEIECGLLCRLYLDYDISKSIIKVSLVVKYIQVLKYVHTIFTPILTQIFLFEYQIVNNAHTCAFTSPATNSRHV